MFKKNIGLPRADHQALGKESYLPRVDHQAGSRQRGRFAESPTLGKESREHFFLFLRAFFYFCLYFQLQQHIFHKYNTSSTSHISQICHPHHMSHIIIHLNISNPTTHVHLKVLSSSHTSSCHKVLIHDEEQQAHSQGSHPPDGGCCCGGRCGYGWYPDPPGGC